MLTAQNPVKASQLTQGWKLGEWWVVGLLVSLFLFRTAGWPTEGEILAALTQEAGKEEVDYDFSCLCVNGNIYTGLLVSSSARYILSHSQLQGMSVHVCVRVS